MGSQQIPVQAYQFENNLSYDIFEFSFRLIFCLAWSVCFLYKVTYI